MKPEAKPEATKLTAGVAALLFCLVIPGMLRAQSANATLSGTVLGPAGTAVANATVSVKNLATRESNETQTNAAGVYTVPNLPAGEYQVSASAKGLGTRVAKVTLTPDAKQTLDLALPGPAGYAGAPSLSDLGFSPGQTQGSAEAQARLNKRSHMLMIHQRLGLITLAPLLATLIVSNGAAGRHSTAGGRELHGALGGVTAGMYFTTAYFAIFAPKVPGTKVRGQIRVHKALAWIHGPGMILTPILAAMAYSQLSNGQRVHGIAKAHGPVAIVTAAAYGAAILSVSIKF
jgi:Carboxypeptidase regulatory-like domain